MNIKSYLNILKVSFTDPMGGSYHNDLKLEKTFILVEWKKVCWIGDDSTSKSCTANVRSIIGMN